MIFIIIIVTITNSAKHSFLLSLSSLNRRESYGVHGLYPLHAALDRLGRTTSKDERFTNHEQTHCCTEECGLHGNEMDAGDMFRWLGELFACLDETGGNIQRHRALGELGLFFLRAEEHSLTERGSPTTMGQTLVR